MLRLPRQTTFPAKLYEICCNETIILNRLLGGLGVLVSFPFSSLDFIQKSRQNLQNRGRKRMGPFIKQPFGISFKTWKGFQLLNPINPCEKTRRNGSPCCLVEQCQKSKLRKVATIYTCDCIPSYCIIVYHIISLHIVITYHYTYHYISDQYIVQIEVALLGSKSWHAVAINYPYVKSNWNLRAFGPQRKKISLNPRHFIAALPGITIITTGPNIQKFKFLNPTSGGIPGRVTVKV